MRLTVVGATGSMSGPGSPASCYLVQAEGQCPVSGLLRTFSVLLDLGPGSFGALWRHMDPCGIDALFLSHCHADHMGDIISLQVHRKWGPARDLAPLLLLGPDGTLGRVRQIEGAVGLEDYSGEFAFARVDSATVVRVGPLLLRACPGQHSIESYGVRVEGPSEADPARTASLFYTGDTDECPSIVKGARGVDLLLSEVGFTAADQVRGIHMDGLRAGRVAAEAGAGALVATHIQPWTSHELVRAELARTWDGPLSFARGGAVYEL